MSVHDSDDRRGIIGYQTSIEGRAARGLTVDDDTMTEWLETTEPVILEDWR